MGFVTFQKVCVGALGLNTPCKESSETDSVRCLAKGTANKSQLNIIYLSTARKNGRSIVVGDRTAAALRTLSVLPDQSTTLVRLQGLAGQSPASPKSIQTVLGMPSAVIGASSRRAPLSTRSC